MHNQTSAEIQMHKAGKEMLVFFCYRSVRCEGGFGGTQRVCKHTRPGIENAGVITFFSNFNFFCTATLQNIIRRDGRHKQRCGVSSSEGRQTTVSVETGRNVQSRFAVWHMYGC